MAATGLQVNWDDVSFTPTSGSAIPITRVTNISVGNRAENIRFKADMANHDQVIVNVNNTQSVTITSGDVATLMGLPVNTTGVLTMTHKDARGQTGGDIIYELDCICGGSESSGAHAQFGTGTATFEGFSGDGVTNPLAFTRA